MMRVELRMTAEMKDELFGHLFPGDDDEHGAVIAAGVSRTPRGIRLIARDLFPAEDGRDYVPGRRGYRMLTGEFVTKHIRYCRDESLCYLAVHNHPGRGGVAFSDDDNDSHERGYPALLDIARGQPVGALVFSETAVAGDIWLTKQSRVELSSAVVVGSRHDRMYPAGAPESSVGSHNYDRQTRLFGDAGQHILAGLKVGVIGAGGVGSLLTEYLSRLGVGTLVVADPERIDVTNVPRVTGSTYWNARAWLTNPTRPRWVREIGLRTAALKVAIARRVATRANPAVRFIGLPKDFVIAHTAEAFVDCDYLFLAADSFQARAVFNAMVFQYLIPGVQVGSKVRTDRVTGDVLDVFCTSRPVGPTAGCLWCNGYIPPARLQEEAATAAERRAQRYVDDPDVIAPSVITLNARAASAAADDFMFSITGLTDATAETGYLRFTPQTRNMKIEEPRRDADCIMCGDGHCSNRGRGDSGRLPTKPA